MIAGFRLFLSDLGGFCTKGRVGVESASSTDGDNRIKEKDRICHHQANNADEAGDDNEDLEEIHVCHGERQADACD